MLMRSRWVWHRALPARQQLNQCLMLGLAAGVMLLAGCGMAGTTGSTGPGSGNVTSSQVRVVPDKQQYRSSETVVATITNGLSASITTQDHQSDCTVVTVERLAGQMWQPQNMCQLKSPTRLVPLAAGATIAQQVRPPTSLASSGWSAGTYRIVFAYRQGATDQDTTIYSATFTVVQ